MKTPNTARGFTLVELLVIIFVLGILATLIIPAVNRMSARAATTDATNKLRQLAIGANLFANDNKEFRITYDCLNGPRYLDAIVSNNVAANFVISACFWEMQDSPEIPPSGTGNFGPGSPKNG